MNEELIHHPGKMKAFLKQYGYDNEELFRQLSIHMEKRSPHFLLSMKMNFADDIVRYDLSFKHLPPGHCVLEQVTANLLSLSNLKKWTEQVPLIAGLDERFSKIELTELPTTETMDLIRAVTGLGEHNLQEAFLWLQAKYLRGTPYETNELHSFIQRHSIERTFAATGDRIITAEEAYFVVNGNFPALEHALSERGFDVAQLYGEQPGRREDIVLIRGALDFAPLEGHYELRLARKERGYVPPESYSVELVPPAGGQLILNFPFDLPLPAACNLICGRSVMAASTKLTGLDQNWWLTMDSSRPPFLPRYHLRWAELWAASEVEEALKRFPVDYRATGPRDYVVYQLTRGQSVQVMLSDGTEQFLSADPQTHQILQYSQNPDVLRTYSELIKDLQHKTGISPTRLPSRKKSSSKRRGP